jgi:hypothetical protein
METNVTESEPMASNRKGGQVHHGLQPKEKKKQKKKKGDTDLPSVLKALTRKYVSRRLTDPLGCQTRGRH